MKKNPINNQESTVDYKCHTQTGVLKYGDQIVSLKEKKYQDLRIIQIERKSRITLKKNTNMAHSISERELRRLRRERFIEDQERQRRLEEEIQLLQRQRDQYVVDQRYRRALNRFEPERDLEEQFSDDGLQMTLDRWSDTSAFETDTDVRQRRPSYTQNPRKDLETQYETTDTLVRNDNREDERIGQQGLKERERVLETRTMLFRTDTV